MVRSVVVRCLASSRSGTIFAQLWRRKKEEQRQNNHLETE
jgi:rRNA processing protein Krr1/Pno1